MELSLLGLVVQTVGAGLLSLIFLYLSRGKGNRVLQAAGVGWLFLFVSLVLAGGAAARRGSPSRGRPTSTSSCSTSSRSCVAAIRMDRDISLVKPLAVAAVAALPLSLPDRSGIGHRELRFYARAHGAARGRLARRRGLHFQSPRAGLGRGSSRGCSRSSRPRRSSGRRRPRDLEVAARRRRRAPAVHRLLRRAPRDALRHRPDHLGDGGHGAPAGDAARAHGRRHAPVAAARVARSADGDEQPLLPRRDPPAARVRRAGRLHRPDRRRRPEAESTTRRATRKATRRSGPSRPRSRS